MVDGLTPQEHDRFVHRCKNCSRHAHDPAVHIPGEGECERFGIATLDYQGRRCPYWREQEEGDGE